MAIKANFTERDIRAKLERFLKEVAIMQIEALKELGEMCVTHARGLPPEVGFHDQSGNLRSSIGYMVFKDGVPVHESFDQVIGGIEGVKRGQDLAKKTGAEHNQGLVLVVTAGMNYALYVESKGRDVIASAKMLARRELPRMLSELKRDINKALE